MTDLQSLLSQAVEELRRGRLRFALVGGLAVSVRTEPRFTRDIDLVISVGDDAESERAVAAFLGRGYRLVSQLEQEATGRLAAVRLESPSGPGEGPVLDLLFASSGIEPEIVNELVIYLGPKLICGLVSHRLISCVS